MSSDVVNGSEAALLEILWIRKSDNFTVALHSVKGAYNIIYATDSWKSILYS